MKKDAQTEEQSKLVQWYEWSKPYVWPWFAVPVLIMYAIDFIGLVSVIVKIGCALFIGAQVAGFVLGVYFCLATKFTQNKTDIGKIRLFKYLPTYGWGFSLTTWLLEDAEKSQCEK